MAEKVISYAWTNGGTHPLLSTALKAVNMTLDRFNELRREANKVTRGRDRLAVLTPCGVGVRI